MANRCFMIQPFDGAKFDKRFEDVFQPAVFAAGLQPYRVDRDASAAIPIEQIEEGIRQASVCFADVTLDNPNVWFELGYAIAVGKDICIVCSEEREARYPFDIQHRQIIRYKVESRRDYSMLEQKITERLNAISELQATRAQIPSVSKERTEESGLAEHEIACLAAIGLESSGLETWVSNYRVKSEMEKLGFNNLACNVALRNLRANSYIRSDTMSDQDGEHFEAYSITDSGWAWIDGNVQSLNLSHTPAPARRRRASGFDKSLDDEIPF